jgi:GxxExxY protein
MLKLDDRMNDLAGRVIGAAIEVHWILGPGYLESIYEEALCIELSLRGMSFDRQMPFEVHYKGRVVGSGRIDMGAALFERRKNVSRGTRS